MAYIDMRTAWNQVAAHYQRRHAIPTDSAHYGPWAPLENELRLLGDVSGPPHPRSGLRRWAM
ncbi:MAG: hypothetical protein IPM07_24675 [Anaerolineales bacterium]|nr:hypothetical protein [Anaerolineales bacterium]